MEKVVNKIELPSAEDHVKKEIPGEPKIRYEKLFEKMKAAPKFSVGLLDFAAPVTTMINTAELISSSSYSGSSDQQISPQQSLSDLQNLPLGDPRLKIESFNQVIYLNSKNHEFAKQAFDLIETKGLNANEISYANLMNAFEKANDLGSVLDYFEQMIDRGLTPNVYHYNILLKSFVNAGRMDAAQRLFAKLKQEGVFIDQTMYSVMLKGYLRNKKLDKLWKLYETLKKEDVHIIDQVTYSILIDACEQERNPEKAFVLFKEMIKSGVDPTDVVFKRLIKASCSRHDTYLDSFQLLNEMRTYGFVPDIHVFEYLLSGCAKAGDLSFAYMVWEDIQRSGFDHTEKCYVELMKVLAKKRRFELLREKQHRRSEEQKLNQKIYMAKISQFVPQKKKLQELENEDIDLVEEIDEKAKQEEKELEELFALQREREKSFLKENNPIDISQRLIQEIKEKSIPITKRILLPYFQIFADMRLYKECFQEMKKFYGELDYQLNEQDYEILLSCFLGTGEFKKAKAVWDDLKSKTDLAPLITPLSFNNYAAIAAESHQFHHMIHVCQEMKDRNLRLNSFFGRKIYRNCIAADSIASWLELKKIFGKELELYENKEK